MALMQDDIKKVLAYSSISQMGYILFGISSESILGITGGTMMYVTHGLGKAILFMMAGSIILQTGTRSMSKLGGLAGKMPYTGSCNDWCTYHYRDTPTSALWLNGYYSAECCKLQQQRWIR